MRNFLILSVQRKLSRFWLFLGLVGLSCFASLGTAAEIISAGQKHTCGIKADGSIICWGSNFYGQTEQPTEHFTQVSINTNYNCGLKTDGNVVCWGISYYDDIGVPSDIFTQIDLGYNHACGLKIDSNIECWGKNENGQATPPDGSFTQVSSGDFHSCGIRLDGGITCWGDNDRGKANPPIWSFTQISAGKAETCGVKTNGDVECWGIGSKAPSGSFIEVSVGVSHVCGIKTDGTVECWGTDHYGETTPPEGIFVQISAGQYHTCGLRTDGSVECWGKNDDGQATPPAGVRFALPDVEITPENPTTLTYEEGLEAGKQICINDPTMCGIQAQTPVPSAETIKQQCVDDPASCGIQVAACDSTLPENDVVYDEVTQTISIPVISIPIESEEGVQIIEPFEAQFKLEGVDEEGNFQLGVARLNHANEPLPDILPEHPALDKGLELTKLYLTMKNKSGAAEILGKLQKADDLLDFLNGINQYADNPTKQVLYALEYFLKKSKYIFLSGLVPDGILTKAYDALEGHFDNLSKITGKVDNFYIRLKKERFGPDKAIGDATIQIHQITHYHVPMGPPGEYTFSEDDITYTGKYIGWAYGYSFKTEQDHGIESGLYVAEIHTSFGTFTKPVFVKLEFNQTATITLD